MQLIYKDQPHPDTASCLLNLGNAYQAKGQHDNAIKYFIKSFEMSQLIYRDQPHYIMATTLINLADAYYAKGQYDEAKSYYTQGLHIAQLTSQVEQNHNIAHVLNNLGGAYYATKQYKEAIDYYTKSLIMMELIYKNEADPEIAGVLSNIGRAYRSKGEYCEAIRYGSKALQMISIFSNHPCQDLIKGGLLTTAQEFATYYSLDPKKIAYNIRMSATQGIDFTDFIVHQGLAQCYFADNRLSDAVRECKLALIFCPREALEARSVINDSLAIIQDTTPLIQAVTNGNEEIVRALLSKRADVNKPDSQQASPLYYSLGYAEQPVNMQIVRLLLEHRADPNQPMFDGDTPMHMAHYNGNKEAVRLLLKYKANINAVNAEGKTPLHCLLEMQTIGHATKLEVIKEFSSIYDLTICDKNSKTVTDYAQQYCPETLQLLSTNLQQSVALFANNVEIAGDINNHVSLE